MNKQSRPIASARANAEQVASGHSPTAPDPAAERWLGVSNHRDGAYRPDPVQSIGSAHGPRLLELLRAS